MAGFSGAGLARLQLYRLRVRRIEAQFGAVLAERTASLARFMTTWPRRCWVFRATGSRRAHHAPEAEAARTHLDRVRLLVRHGIAEARRYVWDLRSQALENNDLPTALSETARRLTVETAVEARVQISGTFRPLSVCVEDNLLRIAQEAINNAVKHAAAQRVFVDLVFDTRHVQLNVRDDGHGFDSQTTNGATGHFWSGWDARARHTNWWYLVDPLCEWHRHSTS